MRDLTVGVFDHLDIISPMDLDQKVAYTQRILRGYALKNYREVLVACRQSAKELAVDEWILGKLTGLFAEYFWTWAKTDTTGYDRNAYLAIYKCVDLYRGIWLELGKFMWRKHHSVYQDHLKYIRNYIVKPFRVKIIRYAERVREMHDLAKYLLPLSMKGESAEADNWTFRY